MTKKPNLRLIYSDKSLTKENDLPEEQYGRSVCATIQLSRRLQGLSEELLSASELEKTPIRF